MTDNILENNRFYKYLRKEQEDQLKEWCEPDWLVCVPQDGCLTEYDLTPIRAAGHALKQYGTTGNQYTSDLYGTSIIYEITGDEPRVIISHIEDDNKIIVSKIIVLNEYLVSVKDKVVHILLLDKVIENTEDEDQLCLLKVDSLTLSISDEANNFLRSFRAHLPILAQLEGAVLDVTKRITEHSDVNEIQRQLHDVILYFWDVLIKTHTSLIQTNSNFQDLLFRALDFFVGTKAHRKLLWLAKEKCFSVDQMTHSQVGQLREAKLAPHHLGVASNYYTPLPAAVVELATLASVESAIGRLHCINATLDLIQAQAKEARLNLHQYQNKDGEPELEISSTELRGLLTSIIIETQCSDLVSNIYYMTHFVFSISDEQDCLWQSLGFLRASLQQIMELDLNNLPKIASPVRKELSLQDLMKVSVDMESRLEKPSSTSSQSTNDITALDLQLHQVTQRIQLSTLAQSDTHLTSRNSSQRRSDRGITTTTNPGRRQSFVEFLSNIPSSIRASFRKKQSQQKLSVQESVHSTLPASLRQQLKIDN